MWMLFVCFLVFNELGIHGKSINLNKLGGAKSLTFPADSSESEDGDMLYTRLSPNCRNQTFCDNLKYYPDFLFYKVLESSDYGTKYSQYFRNMAETEPIVTRNQKSSEYFICSSKKSIVYPRAAYNTKKQLKFIYNLEGYKQGVAIDVCVGKNKCKFYDKVRNFKTYCRQKFVEKLLLTADANGRPYVDRYKFPSACVCSYKDVSNYSRFATLYDKK